MTLSIDLGVASSFSSFDWWKGSVFGSNFNYLKDLGSSSRDIMGYRMSCRRFSYSFAWNIVMIIFGV